MKIPVTNPPDDFIKATSGNQRGRFSNFSYSRIDEKVCICSTTRDPPLDVIITNVAKHPPQSMHIPNIPPGRT